MKTTFMDALVAIEHVGEVMDRRGWCSASARSTVTTWTARLRKPRVGRLVGDHGHDGVHLAACAYMRVIASPPTPIPSARNIPASRSRTGAHCERACPTGSANAGNDHLSIAWRNSPTDRAETVETAKRPVAMTAFTQIAHRYWRQLASVRSEAVKRHVRHPSDPEVAHRHPGPG